MWPKRTGPHCQLCFICSLLKLHCVNPSATEPMQPPVKTLTHLLPPGKGVEHDEEERVCEEEAFAHLFCLFSKTNRGHAAALIAWCLLHLNFKLGVHSAHFYGHFKAFPPSRI